jgi:predicted  nucleic acid-binding Zn-ribbon protein
MAHFKCAACHARVWRDGTAEAHRDDPCPHCGGPLRALRARPDARPSIAEYVREAIARNDADRRRRLRSAASHRAPRDAR